MSCQGRGLAFRCQLEELAGWSDSTRCKSAAEASASLRLRGILRQLDPTFLPGELSVDPSSYRGGEEGNRLAEALGTWAHQGWVCEQMHLAKILGGLRRGSGHR